MYGSMEFDPTCRGDPNMLPFPPVIAATVAAVGVIVVSRMLTREWHRVNDALEVQRATATVRTKDVPTLRRDPITGEYRPM